MSTNNTTNNSYYKTTTAFSARLNTSISNATGDATIINPVIFDTCDFGSDYYDITTGLYTAPLDGIYRFESVIWLSNITFSTTDAIKIWLVYSDTTTALGDIFGVQYVKSTDNDAGILVTDTKQLTAAQTVQVAVSVSGGTKIVALKATSFFSGFLLGQTV